MNRQEAIRILKKELEITKYIDKRFGDFPEHREALELAIKALEQEPTTKNDLALIHTEGLDEGIRCAMCTNSMKSDRGCDGGCVVNKDMYKAVMDAIEKHIQPSVTPQEPQSFKWCTDCREYDQEKHCCHRWSKVIRDTVEEMKQEQEPILDKIRAEIEDLTYYWCEVHPRSVIDDVLAIIDKYKAESEPQESEDKE